MKSVHAPLKYLRYAPMDVTIQVGFFINVHIRYFRLTWCRTNQHYFGGTVIIHRHSFKAT